MAAIRTPARRGHKHSASDLLDNTLTAGDILYVDSGGDLSLLAAGSNGEVLTLAAGVPSWAASGGGASQLSDLSDVVSATNTNRFALMANGTTGYVGRALVEADISDLGSYATQLSELSDVVSATNTNRFALMANGTTGYVGRALVEADISDLGTYLTSPVGETDGGTGQTTYTTGDVLYASASNTLSKLAVGTNGQVLTLAAGVPSWADTAAAGTLKQKTADQTYTSTTTPQNDTHLTGWTLDANSWYIIEGFLSATSGTTPDLALIWSFSQTPQDGDWAVNFATSGGSTGRTDCAAITGSLVFIWGTTAQAGTISGAFKSNASTGGTLTLQHAQASSNVTSTGLLAGSWIRITKVG